MGDADDDTEEEAPSGDDPRAGPDVTVEARTFVLLVVSSGWVAWQVGFDLGAFETVDYRWFWSIWVLSVVALVASIVFRSSGYEVGWPWRFVLAIPTIRVVADYFLPLEDHGSTVALALALMETLTFPLALYLLARLFGGDFFGLRLRTRTIAAIVIVLIFLIGLLLGDAHPKYLNCEDFELIGDYVPPDCTP